MLKKIIPILFCAFFLPDTSQATLMFGGGGENAEQDINEAFETKNLKNFKKRVHHETAFVVTGEDGHPISSLRFGFVLGQAKHAATAGTSSASDIPEAPNFSPAILPTGDFAAFSSFFPSLFEYKTASGIHTFFTEKLTQEILGVEAKVPTDLGERMKKLQAIDSRLATYNDLVKYYTLKKAAASKTTSSADDASPLDASAAEHIDPSLSEDNFFKAMIEAHDFQEVCQRNLLLKLHTGEQQHFHQIFASPEKVGFISLYLETGPAPEGLVGNPTLLSQVQKVESDDIEIFEKLSNWFSSTLEKTLEKIIEGAAAPSMYS